MKVSVEDAIKAAVLKNGSQTAVAKILGVTPQYIYFVKKNKKFLPVTHRVTPKKWEKATGIKKEYLFPHLFK